MIQVTLPPLPNWRRGRKFRQLVGSLTNYQTKKGWESRSLVLLDSSWNKDFFFFLAVVGTKWSDWSHEGKSQKWAGKNKVDSAQDLKKRFLAPPAESGWCPPSATHPPFGSLLPPSLSSANWQSWSWWSSGKKTWAEHLLNTYQTNRTNKYFKKKPDSFRQKKSFLQELNFDPPFFCCCFLGLSPS